ncbi:MAG TPA: amidase [Methylomirabilota bacterium]|jgi:aspartyl-tRNA(Asn)/glutamyl-tRNA(Gln) amidotransferase subunit A|nr:amidase [Methylomirabilota bacterium]
MRSTELGVQAAAAAVKSGEVTSQALVDACLERIRAVDGTVKAWIHVDEAGARAAARAADAAVRPGATLGALHGVPVGIKDIIDVAGLPTTAGARAFAHRTPSVDATCVARLRAAGAVVLGKTHTTQFAYRDPAPTANPWNLGHTPGGSSSGSAAAVAARMVPVALGSQTVGSILRPAAYCGVVGLKGTNGLVPLDGVVPLGYSLDHIGPLARSVEDAALVLGVMAGRSLTPEPVATPRLALARELFDRAEPELRAHLEGVVQRLAKAGARVEEVRLPPSFADLADAALVILEVEAATYHEPTFGKHAPDYGPGMAEMLARGLKRVGIEYVAADRRRARFRADVLPLLRGYDALLSPTAPQPAPAGLAWTGDASLCQPWSSIGAPSISLPSGVSAAGLPLALQLVGAHGDDPRLLGTARWTERALDPAPAPPLA